jgi:hypothetical protein
VISRSDVDAARACIAALARYAHRPASGARLALHAGGRGSPWRPHTAHAQIALPGRLLAARTIGPTAAKAAEEAALRLRRQLLAIAGAEVALRNDPRAIDRAMRDVVGEHRPPPPVRPKPPEEREIVPRHTYAPGPEPTLEAVADLLDLDEQFHLFSHTVTGEDAVVHWRSDGRIGLLHPPGSRLADERDVVVPMRSRYSDPLPLESARAEMDALDHRFLYFIEAGIDRGRVLYLRFDGDYGLVQPW